MEHTPTTVPEAEEAAVSPGISLDVPDDMRMARLVEFVRLLTGCTEAVAIHAVRRSLRRRPGSADDALEVVARAMVSVSRGVDLREQIDLDQGLA